MKRTLIVMRHAKTEPQQIDQRDFDRNLLERGKVDALNMSKKLRLKNIIPQFIIASSANRTRQTAKIAADTFQIKAENILFQQQLYLCSPHVIEESVLAIPDEVSCSLLIGHNPGVSEFIYESNPAAINVDIPTAGLVVFSFEADSWQSFPNVKKTFELYDYPNDKL